MSPKTNRKVHAGRISEGDVYHFREIGIAADTLKETIKKIFFNSRWSSPHCHIGTDVQYAWLEEC